MIFNKYYDRALWLILQGDKNNRELINSFINNLTNEMYECIYNLQKKYSEGSSFVSVHSELIGDGFRFLVQINESVLTIVLNKFDAVNPNNLGERYELSLLPVVDSFLENKKIDGVKIGAFSYKKTKKVNQETSSFQMSTLEDVFYKISADGSKNILTTCDSCNYKALYSKRVNMSRLPDKIYSQAFQLKKGKCRTRKK